MSVLDVLGLRTDQEILNFSIGRSRDDAWRHAVVLAHLPPEHVPEAIAVLDHRKTAFAGGLVADPGGRAGPAFAIVSATESADVVAINDALDQIE